MACEEAQAQSLRFCILGLGAWHGLKSNVTLEAPMKEFEKPMQ